LNIKTNLADGTYQNRAGSDEFTVKNGYLTGTIQGREVVVLYGNTTNDETNNNSGNTSDNNSGSNTNDNDSNSTTTETKKVYFEKPSSWGNKVYAYVYNKNTQAAVTSAWPGKKMTALGNDEYELDLDTAETDADLAVIFTDGTNQTPAAMQSGFAFDNNTVYDSNGATTESIPTTETETVTFEKPSSWSNTLYAYVYDLKTKQVITSTWPGDQMTENSDGNYTFTLDKSKNNGDLAVIFTDGTHQTPAASQDGFTFMADTTYDQSGVVATSDSNSSADGSSSSSSSSSSSTDTNENSSSSDPDNSSTDTQEETVTFKKPSSWGNTLYAYVYDLKTKQVITSTWPGDQMTKTSDGEYTFTLDKSKDNGDLAIIFTDGNNQTPGQNLDGFDFVAGAVYDENGQTTATSSDTTQTETISFQRPSYWNSKVYAYVYDLKTKRAVTSSWPGDEMTENSDGSYTITLDKSKDNGDLAVIFTDGSNQTPATQQSGYSFVAGSQYSIVGNLDSYIVFQKPNNWNSNVYAYVYDASTGKAVTSSWPGNQMTAIASNLYVYQATSTSSNLKVLFSDGSGNQTPGVSSAGDVYQAGAVYDQNGKE
jgi:hypothetical protein